jgi:hypothetical protein
MSSIRLSLANGEWLARFRRAYGRAPRMLHIGNIANNAYNNAKLLNDAGLDCDVACYDYYHIMGCPEWEDADFDGEPKDHFHPDWDLIDLKGFVRPAWFSQGPLEHCIAYLDHTRAGRSASAVAERWQLALANHTVSQLGDSPPPAAKRVILRARVRQNRVARVLRGLLHDPNVLTRIDQQLHGKNERTSPAWNFGTVALALPLVAAAAALRLVMLPLAMRPTRDTDVERRIKEIAAAFRAAFPDRADPLTSVDLLHYRHVLPLWCTLFRHYDIVQGYSTDPVLPMLANKPYFAFEHGTLRDIPFEPSNIGRATAIAYHLARHVFVTNFDCQDNARHLAGDRFTLINHPYDEDHGIDVAGWESLRAQLCAELDADFIFFFPTRQDWVPGTGYADKANEVFLRAFATLRRRGFRVGMVACRWGANVSQSVELLDALGCSRNVRWCEPMPMVKFERMAKACHCVVDQFKLGAFGGVMFKAMAVGSPICTYLDEQRIRRQYPESPPVINCRTEVEIVDRLATLLADRSQIDALGTGGRAWMKRFHAKDAVVNAQFDQYRLACPA